MDGWCMNYGWMVDGQMDSREGMDRHVDYGWMDGWIGGLWIDGRWMNGRWTDG